MDQQQRQPRSATPDAHVSDEDLTVISPAPKPTSSRRGRGRGRGAKSTTSRTSARSVCFRATLTSLLLIKCFVLLFSNYDSSINILFSVQVLFDFA